MQSNFVFAMTLVFLAHVLVLLCIHHLAARYLILIRTRRFVVVVIRDIRVCNIRKCNICVLFICTLLTS